MFWWRRRMHRPRFLSASILGRLLCARMGISTMSRMTARPTATMGRIGMRAGCSSERGRGSMGRGGSSGMSTIATILITDTTDRCLSVGRSRSITSTATRRGTDEATLAMRAMMRAANMRCLDIGAVVVGGRGGRAGSEDVFMNGRAELRPSRFRFSRCFRVDSPACATR